MVSYSDFNEVLVDVRSPIQALNAVLASTFGDWRVRRIAVTPATLLLFDSRIVVAFSVVDEVHDGDASRTDSKAKMEDERKMNEDRKSNEISDMAREKSVSQEREFEPRA